MHTFSPSASKRSGTESDPIVNTRPQPRGWLYWHPARWECVNGEWLPDLRYVREDPGVGGVAGRQTDQGIVADFSRAEIALLSRGWQPLDDTRPLYPGAPETYQKRIRTRYGYGYVTIWQSYKSVGTQTYSQHDDEGWNAFRRGLVAHGVIPEPDTEILEMKVQRQRDRAHNVARRPGELEDVKAREAARLAELEAAQVPKQPKRRSAANG